MDILSPDDGRVFSPATLNGFPLFSNPVLDILSCVSSFFDSSLSVLTTKEVSGVSLLSSLSGKEKKEKSSVKRAKHDMTRSYIQVSRWSLSSRVSMRCLSRETVDLVLYSFLLFFPVLIVFMSVLDLFIWFWLSSKRTHKLKNMFHFKFSFMSLFQHAFVVIILQCITWFRKVLCFVFSLVCSYFLSFFYLWHKEKVSSVKDELKFEGRRDSIRDMMTIMMKLCRWIHRMMNEWDSRGKGKTSSVQRESLLSLSSFSIICLNPLDDGLVSWFRILFLSLLFLHIRSSSWRRKGRDRHLDEILLSYPAHSLFIPFSSFICLQVILHPWFSLSFPFFFSFSWPLGLTFRNKMLNLL